MGIARFVELGVLTVFLQAFTLASSEPTVAACVPHFKLDTFNFTVERNRLQPHRILGKVGFSECTLRTRFRFLSDNTQFTVDTDGTLKVGRRPVPLHGREKNFNVHVWDTQRRKWTVPVNVLPPSSNHHNGSGDGHGHHHHGSVNGHEHHHGSGDGHKHQNGSVDGHKHHHRSGDGHKHHHESGTGHKHHHESGNGHKHHHESGDGHKHHHESRNGHKHHRGSGDGHKHHHESGNGNKHHRGSGEGHKHHHQVSEDGLTKRMEDHHHEFDAANKTEIEATPDVPVLYFSKARGGLQRRKRAWVIPPISYPENDRGPFPKQMVQIRSDSDKEVSVLYSITGPGADQPPVGLFTVDRNSGQLYVTQPLDREKQATYHLQAHAVVSGSGNAEEPMEIIVKVIDQNDNNPVFPETTYTGEVAEASPKGFEVITVTAIDADEPNTDNSDIHYAILTQTPQLPSDNMFFINLLSGVISVNAAGLDREKYPTYTLEVQAADMRGKGLTGKTKVILTVTDSNDNAPAFERPNYEATVPENKVGAEVAKMTVTDLDDANTPAWAAKFTIVSGDPEGLFAVTTGLNKQEGIITTAKGLDFEKNAKYTLLVAVENEVPFAVRLPTATATVVVDVEDVNEAPVFSPGEKLVVHREDLAVGADVVRYTATDPDTARAQTVSYKILSDVAGWLSVGKDTGVIKVKSKMDRESHFVKDDKYTALIGAYDNDDIPATGTGTLVIKLEDVNDNPPTVDARHIKVCNKESEPQLLSVTDKDGPGFAAPYSVKLQGDSHTNWTATMNDTKTGILLRLNLELARGVYSVVMRVADNHNLEQDSTIEAEVCDCTGPDVVCKDVRAAAFGLPAILGILGAILLLLLLVLLLLMFMRRRGGEKKEPLLQEDDIRDNIYYYDEEGGGEDDQDYDLGVLHRGLDNRPDVVRNDMIPTYLTAPRYRPRPANPEDIGNFIDDNLKAADNDPTAPPYDSLLVFDYEGGGSDAGSLSSLNSDSSGDQDYDCFGEWGPRFKKLADMYGGGEDDDML